MPENIKYLCKVKIIKIFVNSSKISRVSVQGVKSLGGHFACLCWRFDYYEVEKYHHHFFKKKWEISLNF